MTSAVRLTIEDIFQTVADLAPDARAAYLDEVCGNDERLRREVEELLRFDAPAESFLEQPAFQNAARDLAKDLTLRESTLAEAGRMLGPYRILGELGRGGMGVVYLGFDTRNERQVAIKVLPSALRDDEDRLARFTREGRMLAELKRLKHPNIAEIYEQAEYDGKPIIALEYVPGETLAERLDAGPLSSGETLQIALQIADALSSAHAQQIVHRDLKPANIKITPTGQVKVLDFGLAKHFPNELADADLQTRSLSLTESGMLMGTPAYMSPEQWNGRAVDQRTDLWALGCLLYEMLTGRDPFSGRNRAETMKAVFEASPDWKALPAATPLTVQDLIRRCLQREAGQRLSDAEEARRVLAEAITRNRFALWLYFKTWFWKISRKTKVRWAAGMTTSLVIAVIVYLALAQRRVTFNQSDDLAVILPQYVQRLASKADETLTPELVRAALLSERATSQDLLDRHQELLQKQGNRKAVDAIIAEFKERVAETPDSAQFRAILAQAYLFRNFLTRQEEDRSEAIKHAVKAKSLSTESDAIKIAIGQVFNELGMNKEAIELFRQVQSQSPQHAEALLGLAIAYEWLNEPAEPAEKYYQQALDLFAREGKAAPWNYYNEFGSYYLAKGDYQRAAEQFSKVVAANNTNPIGYSNLGQVLLSQGCVRQAISNFTTAVTLDPINESYNNLGAAYIFAKNYQEAVHALEPVTKTAAPGLGNLPEAWLNLGDAYAQLGRNEDAVAAYQQGLDLTVKLIDPRRADPVVEILKAELIAKLNRLDPQTRRDDPIALLDATLQTQPDCFECLGTGAVAYQVAGDRSKALRTLSAAVERGYSPFLLVANPDLAALKSEPEFQRIAAEAYSRCPAP